MKNFNLSLPRGCSSAGLIGPNGAREDHRFQPRHGPDRHSSGEIGFGDERIDGLEPHEITRLGIARTFQNIRLFSNLSVLDNVRIAYHPHAGYGLSDSLLRTPKFTRRKRS